MKHYPKTIFEAVRDARREFLDTHIELVDGVDFNQYEVVKKVHKYYSSHREKGDYETIKGVTRKLVFFNINKWRCDVATKMIDQDMKNFVLIPDPAPEMTDEQIVALDAKVSAFQKELKYWLKQTKMGAVLNDISRRLPIYGSYVLRKTKDGAEGVDLRKLINDQSAVSLDKGRYTIIRHEMSASDLRKMQGKWDNVEDVIDRYCSLTLPQSYEDRDTLSQAAGSPFANVYEVFMEVPTEWLEGKEYFDGNKTDYVLARFILAGVDDLKIDEQGQQYENGLVLFKEELSEFPLKEVHYNKIEGRWLGVGVVEDTFEDQRVVNAVKDAELKAYELSNLILFQTPDDTTQKNLLVDVDNGEMIKAKNPINRLDNSNRALGEGQTISQAYELHADRMTFSQDVIRGEQAPGSTTATAVMNQVQQAASVYDYKSENVSLFLKYFIEDLVYPDLKRKLKKRHKFRYTGDTAEMDKVRSTAFNFQAAQSMQQGIVPLDEMELEGARQDYMREMGSRGAQVWLDIEENWYDDLRFYMDLELSGESRNIQQQFQYGMQLLQLLAPNPQLFENPLLKRALYKVLSAMGMSISEFEAAEQEYQEMKAQQQQQAMQMETLKAQLNQPPMSEAQPVTQPVNQPVV